MTNKGFVGCTIVAGNYLAYARVLADGWRRHHADAPFLVLVIDDEGEGGPLDGFVVVTATHLGVPTAELARMRGIYGVAELTTALKPHFLRTLLDSGAAAVVFLDSDNDVHADLAEVASLATRHGVVLSPHLLGPPPLDGWSPTEPEIAWSGLFNSGFLAVGQSGRPFLDWWASRLRRDCLFCEPMGTHADQKWLDFVPSYFEHRVLRDPGVNVAQWNLHERRIRWEGGGFTVNGAPLRAFHFSGFDPEAAGRPAADGWPKPLRFRMDDEPGLARLCREYADKLLAAGHRELRTLPYRYATAASGRTLGIWERRAYREVVIAAEARGGWDLPDPFDVRRSVEFERMLADPGSLGLLSEAALARLNDARLADLSTLAGPAGRLRAATRLVRQAVRRIPGRRHGWMPYPQPSDRTLLEYLVDPPEHAAAHSPAIA